MSEPRDPRGTVDEDRMLDLLHGLLPEEERRDTLAQLAGDPEAERRFRERARGLERAKARGVPALREEPVSFFGRIAGTVRRPSPPALIGFGAAVAIAVALFRLPAGPDPDAFHPLPSDTQTLLLRSADSLPAGILDGLQAYAARDWAGAAAILEKTPAEDTPDVVRRIYLASSLAMADRHGEALDALEGVPLELLPEPWGSEARWTRAMALRRAGREEEARAALQALSEDEGPVGERARTLLTP